MTVQVFNFIHADNSRKTVFSKSRNEYNMTDTGAETPYSILTCDEITDLYDFLKVLEKGGIGKFTHEDKIVLSSIGR